MMDPATLVGVVGITVSVASMFVYELWLRGEIAEAQLETSRYPMFAVRHQLVMLVARGRMREHDPAWQTAYRGINVLLNPRNTIGPWRFMWVYLTHCHRIDRDPRYRAEWMRHVAATDEAKRRVREFADVMTSYTESMHVMMARRSSPLRIRLLRVTLRFAVWWFLGFRAGATRVGKRQKIDAKPTPAQQSAAREQCATESQRTARIKQVESFMPELSDMSMIADSELLPLAG